MSYTPEFFDRIRVGAQRSAAIIAPRIMQLFNPKSVLDVGCAQGTWLSAFIEQGVEDVYGVDGDYVCEAELEISPERFIAANLTQAFDLGRQFDIVLSLEVAEHIPEECADEFVGSLVRHSACIMFSAAIPHQGGTFHVNEQWPSYWEERFAVHGYKVWDLLRAECWTDMGIEPWYSQNMLCFVRQDEERRFSCLAPSCRPRIGGQLDLVHPSQYLKVIEAREIAEKSLWECRVQLMQCDVEKHVPHAAPIILLDNERLSFDVMGDHPITRVSQSDGIYWGSPGDLETAIERIENLRHKGVSHLVQTWLTYWWQERFPGFDAWLSEMANCQVSNDRCRIYEFTKL